MKKDVKFRDGAEFTAGGVPWSFEKIMADKKSHGNTDLVGGETISVEASDKVKFALKSPFAPFDRQVSKISILPREVYERGGAAFAGDSVGSGPFKVLSWVKCDRFDRGFDVIRSADAAGTWDQGFGTAGGRIVDLLLGHTATLAEIEFANESAIITQ
jgi:hypothetical protein